MGKFQKTRSISHLNLPQDLKIIGTHLLPHKIFIQNSICHFTTSGHLLDGETLLAKDIRVFIKESR